MMLGASSLSITLTLGDQPVVKAELMLQDRIAAADYMKQKSTAVTAFTKVLQQKKHCAMCLFA